MGFVRCFVFFRFFFSGFGNLGGGGFGRDTLGGRPGRRGTGQSDTSDHGSNDKRSDFFHVSPFEVEKAPLRE